VGRHRILSGAVLTKTDSLKGFQPHSATSGVRLKYSMAQVKLGPLKKIDRHLLIKLIDRPIGQNINQYGSVNGLYRPEIPLNPP
jgi:hypothetical protein